MANENPQKNINQTNLDRWADELAMQEYGLANSGHIVKGALKALIGGGTQ